MCYAIVEVKYIAAGEQDQLVRCTDEIALNKKVNELKSLGTVASIQTFAPVAKLKRMIVWEVADETSVQVQLEDRILEEESMTNMKRVEG